MKGLLGLRAFRIRLKKLRNEGLFFIIFENPLKFNLKKLFSKKLKLIG